MGRKQSFLFVRKPSRRTFERNKVQAPEIDSLWEADLAFVQDVAKENDAVNYLLVVIDVLSKYVWVRPMKNKTARSLLEAFRFFLSEGNLRLWELTKVQNF